MSKKNAVIQFQISSEGEIKAFTGNGINDDGYISIVVPATASHGDVGRLFETIQRTLFHEDFYFKVQAEALSAIDEDISSKLEASIKANKKLKSAEEKDQAENLQLYKALSKYNDSVF